LAFHVGYGYGDKSVNNDAVIASAIRDWRFAREFHRLFPNAEHTIVEAKRNFHSDGWRPVSEWISRARLYDRYVVWLVAAIEIATDGTVAGLEKPQLYVIQLEKVLRSRDEEEGAEWEVACVEFDEADWEQLVEHSGDFASVGLEMTVDAPVDRFASFWHDTRPSPRPAPSDGVALRAPIRFMT
jgi:hypothetical protein